MSKLAIVIPGYKSLYLQDTLDSLRNQTNKDFTVYIGDDDSPHDLSSICEKFKDYIEIRYTRFSNNIGAENLVNQWTRCINLTQTEEWIWLFSDDDLVDNNCVELFYETLKFDDGKFDVYRFNNIVIDGKGDVIWSTPESPQHESSEEMAYNLLLGKRGNSLADHIFSRKIYIESGGLVFTKYAQGADWAMSIRFSQRHGMAVIPNAKFYWRYSNENISAKAHEIRNKTMEGHLQFIRWIVNHFEYLRYQSSMISYSMIIEAAKQNLINNIQSHYKGFDTRAILRLSRFFATNFSMPFLRAFRILVDIKIKTDPKYFNYYTKFARVKKTIHRNASNIHRP